MNCFDETSETDFNRRKTCNHSCMHPASVKFFALAGRFVQINAKKRIRFVIPDSISLGILTVEPISPLKVVN